MKMITRANIYSTNCPFGGRRFMSESFTIGNRSGASFYPFIHCVAFDGSLNSSSWSLNWVRSYNRS